MSKLEQNNSRRGFLKTSLSLIPLTAAASSGIVSLTSNVARAATPAITPKHETSGVSANYVPLYFNNEEWLFLLSACDILIPNDDLGPGAVNEGVPIYIDKQMETAFGYGRLWYMHPPFVDAVPEMGYQLPLIPRQIYRLGISDVNTYCQKTYHKIFAELSTIEQTTVLTKLDSSEIKLENVPTKLFFETLLQNTKEGYLSDPIHGGNQSLASWKLIGFPGARADFMDWINHPNQPYPLGPVSISNKRGS